MHCAAYLPRTNKKRNFLKNGIKEEKKKTQIEKQFTWETIYNNGKNNISYLMKNGRDGEVERVMKSEKRNQ